MTPPTLRTCIIRIGWTNAELERRLGRKPGTVYQWMDRDTSIPLDVAEWLTMAAAWHEANPPPQYVRKRSASDE